MAHSTPALGDTHNFGRRVSVRGDRIHKPRTLVWEHLLLGTDSPLRKLLDEAAAQEGLGALAFGFLPHLQFYPSASEPGGEVERIQLDPLGDLKANEAGSLARIVGRSLALWTWLGVADLHWENLVLGRGKLGQIIFTPIDIEIILSDLTRPTYTKLLPDADPEYTDICRHAAGVRRVLPYLGKPTSAEHVVTMVAAYLTTLSFLEGQEHAIAEVFEHLPGLRETPIRVCLRGTDEYVFAQTHPPWPPLLDGETEQLARGDIPYFFRLYGKKGIHYYADASLTRLSRLPMRGDVPQLEPLLPIGKALRSPSRKALFEEGVFTLLGAFDHRGLSGRHEADGFAVTFKRQTLVVTLSNGEELLSRRNLSAFVDTVYLPCHCGEVRSVFVPAVTTCEAPRFP